MFDTIFEDLVQLDHGTHPLNYLEGQSLLDPTVLCHGTGSSNYETCGLFFRATFILPSVGIMPERFGIDMCASYPRSLMAVYLFWH